MIARRAAAFFLTLVTCVLWLIPIASGERGVAVAQTLGGGDSVTGDFKGAGYQQIATLYDPGDDLGLRIVVMDATPDGKFAAAEWYRSVPNQFDQGRWKVAAADLNRDAKTDLAMLYNDGFLNVHIVVWLSTGTTFAYQGNAGWFRHGNFDFGRVGDFLGGQFGSTGAGGFVITYWLDNFRLKFLYLESLGTTLAYGGDLGAFDSGTGQVDRAQARFLAGHFTRSTGPDQVAMVYQYANFQIKVHVFDTGFAPIGGWSGRWTSPQGFFDITKAKFTPGDISGDKLTDIVILYTYPDFSGKVHVMHAGAGFALVDTSGAAILPPGAAPFYVSKIVAGDWNKDGKGDVATVTADSAGVTHVGRLTSNGFTFTFGADAWVTPAGEVQQILCTGCWPLSGMPVVAGGPSVNRRPLAVKIDNAPAARPHYGISQADVVTELLVEGNITRLAAYFHSQDPATIGAVRSVRFSDRYTTPMVRGALVFSGGSQLMMDLVSADILNGNYVGVSPQLGQGGAFYRSGADGRVAPHNLFTSSAALRQAVNEVGGGGAVTVPAWNFLKSPHTHTAGGFAGSLLATELTVPYRGDARVRYVYDAGTRSYARYQSSSPSLTYVREVDGANGVAIAAKNVVIIATDIWATEVRDDAGGAQSLDMRLTGMGRASIFRDGRRQNGIWSRPSWFDPFIFTSDRGETILLAPGQTWMHIVPIDWSVPSI